MKWARKISTKYYAMIYRKRSDTLWHFRSNDSIFYCMRVNFIDSEFGIWRYSPIPHYSTYYYFCLNKMWDKFKKTRNMKRNQQSWDISIFRKSLNIITQI